jgi:hypothetical protein
MTASETERFQAPYHAPAGSDQENVVNMEAASEYQNPSEYFVPTSEGNVPSLESEQQIGENELELELFLNELRDNEFETMTYEMLQELEGNFEAFSLQHGLTGERESMVANPNFENVADRYFEASIGQMVPKIEAELDSFANYIQTNVPIGAEYDTFKRVVDSYQPIHSEAFIKRLAKRVVKGVKGIAKRGIKLIGKAAKGIAKVGKAIISGPLKAAIRKLVTWIRSGIGKVLKLLVKKAIRQLPKAVQPIVRKALRQRGLAEYQTPISESEARLDEAVAELESYSPEFEEMSNTLSSELESEGYNNELELEEELEELYSPQNQVAELFAQFDTELFNQAESELSHVAQEQSHTPESYTPESYTPESYTPEAYNPESYTPESYTPESYTPESYTPESYTPEAYNPEAYNPMSEAYNPESYTPESYTPESYTPEAYNPESYTPESYTPEAYNPESYTPESYTPESYTPEAYNPESYTPESYTPEAYNPMSEAYTPEAYNQETESERFAVADSMQINQEYEKFVNALTSNPSNFHQEFEQFAPIVLIKGAKIAFKVVPSLRNKVVGLVAQLIEKLIGRWIPREVGNVVYRPLASTLLKLMGLEASNESMQDRVYAEAIANTATEALLNASALPESILQGEQQVLESELELIVQNAVLNNIPPEALGEHMTRKIRTRGKIQYLPKGRHQSLSRPVRITLNKSQIARVRIRGSLLLGDFLRQYYKWDGASNVTLDVAVFRGVPGRINISKILRSYFGRGKPIQLKRQHYRQLHRMTRRTAKVFGIPSLWSRVLPTYFIVRGVTPKTAAGSAEPVVSSEVGMAPPRGNDVSAKVDSLGRYRLSIYLNNQTVKSLKKQGAEGYKEVRATLGRIIVSGQAALMNLLTRIRIPRIIARALVKLLLRLAMRYLTQATTKIMQRLNALANTNKGITISLIVQLPRDFARSLARISPLQIPSLLRKLAKSSFSVAVSAGYNM